MTRRLTPDERVQVIAAVHKAGSEALTAMLTLLGIADQFPDAGLPWTDAEIDAMITELEEAL